MKSRRSRYEQSHAGIWMSGLAKHAIEHWVWHATTRALPYSGQTAPSRYHQDFAHLMNLPYEVASP